MILASKRGVALLQVLIVTALLAGLSAMILRVSLSRSISARKSQHQVTSQMLIDSCMAEVSNIWASKTPEIYAEDLAACQMCSPSSSECPENQRLHTCSISIPGRDTYTVEAEFTTNIPQENGLCNLRYSIINGVDL